MPIIRICHLCHKLWHKEAGSKVSTLEALFPAELIQAIPWGHHAELMMRVKDLAIRHWYMRATIEQGWSRNILLMQIESVAH